MEMGLHCHRPGTAFGNPKLCTERHNCQNIAMATLVLKKVDDCIPKVKVASLSEAQPISPAAIILHTLKTELTQLGAACCSPNPWDCCLSNRPLHAVCPPLHRCPLPTHQQLISQLLPLLLVAELAASSAFQSVPARTIQNIHQLQLHTDQGSTPDMTSFPWCAIHPISKATAREHARADALKPQELLCNNVSCCLMVIIYAIFML